jgi:hypothetical protein
MDLFFATGGELVKHMGESVRELIPAHNPNKQTSNTVLLT